MLLIYLNIIWDFLSFFLIINNLPNYHSNLWKNKANNDNYSSKQLMAYLVFFWGLYTIVWSYK